ncbi:EexN family lipoprotein [Salmonella enterica subsp. enterica serovar Glostrup]|nr:EexN family lipoprotein [Salmonella enterica subsp. enterica serovar Glostrup]
MKKYTGSAFEPVFTQKGNFMKSLKYILMGITVLTAAACNAEPEVKTAEWYMQHHDEVLAKYKECKAAQDNSYGGTGYSDDCKNVLKASNQIKDPDFIKALNKVRLEYAKEILNK